MLLCIFFLTKSRFPKNKIHLGYLGGSVGYHMTLDLKVMCSRPVLGSTQGMEPT